VTRRGVGLVTGGAVALVAAGTGLVVGLLIAPASGHEMRRRWKRRAEDSLDDLERHGRRVVEETAHQAQQLVEDGVARGRRAARVAAS